MSRLSYSTFFRRVHHEDINKVKTFINELLIHKAEVGFRLRIPGTDTYKFVHLNAHYAEKDGEGKWIGTIQDVTSLKKAMDETQKAKVGRKATSIVLFIGIALFLLSEAVLDPFVDALQTSLLIAISFKGGFALFLKPIELFLEKMMLARIK